jgi:hypothetical protein
MLCEMGAGRLMEWAAFDEIKRKAEEDAEMERRLGQSTQDGIQRMRQR